MEVKMRQKYHFVLKNGVNNLFIYCCSSSQYDIWGNYWGIAQGHGLSSV